MTNSNRFVRECEQKLTFLFCMTTTIRPCVQNCSNTEAIKNAVMHGRGITAISSMLVEKECAAGELVMLDVEGLPVNRTINLIYHKNKYISPSIRIMLDVCEKN